MYNLIHHRDKVHNLFSNNSRSSLIMEVLQTSRLQCRDWTNKFWMYCTIILIIKWNPILFTLILITILNSSHDKKERYNLIYLAISRYFVNLAFCNSVSKFNMWAKRVTSMWCRPLRSQSGMALWDLIIY